VRGLARARVRRRTTSPAEQIRSSPVAEHRGLVPLAATCYGGAPFTPKIIPRNQTCCCRSPFSRAL
jgi:hypothetical protein